MMAPACDSDEPNDGTGGSASLLILDTASDQLIDVAAGTNGIPQPGAGAPIDSQHFGVVEPQGLALDPERARLVRPRDVVRRSVAVNE